MRKIDSYSPSDLEDNHVVVPLQTPDVLDRVVYRFQVLSHNGVEWKPHSLHPTREEAFASIGQLYVRAAAERGISI